MRVQMGEADAALLDHNDLSKVAKLVSDPHYQDVMQRVGQALTADDAEQGAGPRTGVLEDDPIYK